MTAEAHVEFDWPRQTLNIYARPNKHQIIMWPDHFIVYGLDPHPVNTEFTEGMVPYLAIPEDIAKAFYDALATHFGFATHDGKALRKDYESERARVDKFIDGILKRKLNG